VYDRSSDPIFFNRAAQMVMQHEVGVAAKGDILNEQGTHILAPFIFDVKVAGVGCRCSMGNPYKCSQFTSQDFILRLCRRTPSRRPDRHSVISHERMTTQFH
jgi:hypothetical protein